MINIGDRAGPTKRLSSAMISNHSAGNRTLLIQISNTRGQRLSYEKRTDNINPSIVSLN